jgi:hypothetical protein
LSDEPVSLGGRTNVDGDPRIIRSIATRSGEAGWGSGPDLVAARLIIADLGRPVTFRLRRDPRFKLV